jgi:hypothetical protein
MQENGDLYLGSAFIGGSNGSGGSSNMTVGVGPLGRSYCFDVVPVASGTTTGQNQIALSQNLPAGLLALTAGTGTTVGVDAYGNTLVVLDCERNVALYSAANHSGSTITVSGYDRYGAPMSQALAGPNQNTVQTTKTFKSIKSISSSGAIASAIMAGVGTSIGLPYRLTDLGYVMSVMYNQTAIVISNSLVVVADTTSPATTTTTDVRGYVTVGATDGAKRLIVNYALPALAAGPNATRVGAAGTVQA